MAAQTITYEDKQYLNENADIPATNKVQDTDMNEIKTVVNNNANELSNEMNHQYIVATVSSSQTITQDFKVPFNQTILNSGNFTLTNSNIIIGENINHIRISFSAIIENWAGSTNYIGAIIKKNNIEVSQTINGSPSAYLSAFLPSAIIEVEQNDVIELDLYSPSGGTLRSGSQNTWLCVEKID